MLLFPLESHLAFKLSNERNLTLQNDYTGIFLVLPGCLCKISPGEKLLLNLSSFSLIFKDLGLDNLAGSTL